MNKDLFLAILAMDSYNRSYGQGISGLDVPVFDQEGNAISIIQIGNASISSDSSHLRDVNDLRLDIDAGFYAIAYDLSEAGIEGLTGTVISYRGTDKNLALPWTEEGSDFVRGYTLAVGDYSVEQAQLAVDFYQEVVGAAEGADLFADNVTATGHSLGGGLAGFVAMISGAEALLFDHMPFGRAAVATNDNQSGQRVAA